VIVQLAGLICFCAGLTVLWSNPQRRINQVVSGLLFLQALWNGAVLTAIQGLPFFNGSGAEPAVSWRRANAIIMAFFPWGIWMLREVVVATAHQTRVRFYRGIGWIVIGGLLVLLSLSDTFIFVDASSPYPVRGLSYFIYAMIGIPAYILLSLQIYREQKSLTGILRLEMRLVALNIAIAAMLVAGFTAAGNLLQIQSLRRTAFLVLPASAVLSVWVMISSRLYDVHQLVIPLAQRTVLIVLLALGGVGIWRYAETTTAKVDVLFLIAVGGVTALWLDRNSREWLDIGGERLLEETRRSVIEIALREHNPVELTSKFELFLATRTRTELAALLFNKGDGYASRDLEFSKDRPGFSALCEIGWITPESIERRRSNPAVLDLAQFVAQENVGAILISPTGSHHPSLILVLGVKKTMRMFTFPEVRQLQNIAELMDNILTRSRLTTQAAERAKMEHLAIMSRGLAHDLKNLITPISSFLVHTDNSFPVNSPEAEVHFAARRSVRVITDYVREALFFSERLSPNFQPVRLAKIFEEVCGITNTRASRQSVILLATVNTDIPLIADAVLLQRMLANLVGNAIDASAAGQTVKISASITGGEKVRLQVVDQGSGIAPENLTRIFDPYFTTKEFGDDVRGFGLGLTICQKIAHLHGGTISVESHPGRGTTFSVDLPQNPVTPPFSGVGAS
jgi:signal transduction histidine kinase